MTEYEERLVAAVTKFESMGADIVSIKGTMERVADAITRLAVVEERQLQANAAIGRAFTELDKQDRRITEVEKAHDQRITEIEKVQPLQKQTSVWVDRAINAALTAVISAVMSLVLVSKTADQAPAKSQNIPQIVAPK